MSRLPCASPQSQYDHVVFPGAVPRSFIGPLALSLISYPVLLLLKTAGLVSTSADAALCIRLILAVLYAASLLFFSHRTFDGRSQAWQRRAFILISALQFQPLFWAGRTTPNGIVSPIVVSALALVFSTTRNVKLSKRAYYVGLALLTASQVIARMELAGIVIPVALYGLCSEKRAGAGYVCRFAFVAITGTLATVAGVGE